MALDDYLTGSNKISMRELDKRMKYKLGDFIPLFGLAYRGIRELMLARKSASGIEMDLNSVSQYIPDPAELKLELYGLYQLSTSPLVILGAGVLMHLR